MRYIYLTILVLVCLGAYSCKKSDLSGGSSDSDTVLLSFEIDAAVSTKSISYDGELGEAESLMRSVRIFAFNSDGTLDNSYYGVGSDLTSWSGIQLSVAAEAFKMIYVLVNEPSGFDVTSIESVDDINNVGFAIADFLNTNGFNADSQFSAGEFYIPMCGYIEVNALPDYTNNTDVESDEDGSPTSEPIEITVGVDRAVARVDLMLDKNFSADGEDITLASLTSETLFTVNGVAVDSYLFEPGSLSKPTSVETLNVSSSEVTLEVEDSNHTSAKRVLSFYTAERTYDMDDVDNRIEIQIDQIYIDGVAKNVESTIILGDATLSEINRNHVYRIYATYQESVEIDVDEFEVLDWEYVEVDSDLEGVIIAVDDLVVMDWLRNSYSFTAAPVSFGANKPIEIYLPVFSGYDSDGIPEYTYEMVDVEAGAGLSYELTELLPESNFLDYITWIESAKLVFTSAYTGYIEYTYTTTAINYKLQNYIIRVKSGNVTKEMKAVYDNGYIPNDLLDGDWKDRAPNGTIFAKRGFAKHPTTTADILYRDDDGYYRGEYMLTASEAQSYCEDELGPKWYLPSKDDMYDILQGVTELGVSYRFQTTGSEYGEDVTDAFYWTSTVDESSSENWWTGNFIKKYVTVTSDNVENWITTQSGSQTLYVRCALDL